MSTAKDFLPSCFRSVSELYMPLVIPCLIDCKNVKKNRLTEIIDVNKAIMDAISLILLVNL